MPKVIERFWGAHRYLSNFYVAPMYDPCWPNKRAQTLEHFFQAHKAELREQQIEILEASTPAISKRLGRKCQKRPDWDEHKNSVMLHLLRLKFDQHPNLTHLLLSTGDAELVEGNTWGDTYWGVCDGVGENWLGKLLMQVRQELRDRGEQP